MNAGIEPRLLTGKIVEVTDIGITINVKGRMGVLQVPLRSVYTDKPLQVDQEVQFYLSYIHVI